MNLNTCKKTASRILKCSPKRIKVDPMREDEIKESVTKADIRSLIKDKAVKKIQAKGVSRARANKIKKQKSKGLQKGIGSRKGKKTARLPKKKVWMAKVRVQRELIKKLHKDEKLNNADYRNLYSKVKGGFFRSKRHLKLYITEKEMVKK